MVRRPPLFTPSDTLCPNTPRFRCARLEIAPEAVEHRLPLRAAARHVVEFLLELGGEVITDIAGEESFEEGGQEPPALLGDEAVLFDRHIGAVLEHLEDRGRSEEHTSELQSLMRN